MYCLPSCRQDYVFSNPLSIVFYVPSDPWLRCVQLIPRQGEYNPGGRQRCEHSVRIDKMSNIKLTYFPARGRAETSRLILAHAGKKFTDERIDFGKIFL